ncbi:MAG: hypothetical protein P8J86_06445 [Phycisphaerales bacterium]|nr:hypothetical protein [Phycisphaerales bacterium]
MDGTNHIEWLYEAVAAILAEQVPALLAAGRDGDDDFMKDPSTRTKKRNTTTWVIWARHYNYCNNEVW